MCSPSNRSVIMKISSYLIFFVLSCVGDTYAAQTCLTGSIFPSTPDSQLIDNGNGTISDKKTGLMWKKCMEGFSGNNCELGSLGLFTWEMALKQPDYINDAGGFGGYFNWRLPNIKELYSIVESQCKDPAINLNRFPNTPSLSDSAVWSNSPDAANSTASWTVNFNSGYINGSSKRTMLNQVRLVRSEQ